MSKLNTFAAVLKFINGRNDDSDSLRAVCDYTTDKTKTKDGTLIDTHGCSLEHPIEDMLRNKRLHNKTHGKQYEHFVLAPCPNGLDKSPENVLKATKEIVTTVFPEYMAVITVHVDTKVVHAHTVLDTVNAVTGRKFSQSPSDLNKVKQKANTILKKHGFEIITASANEFVDHTDYSKKEGFDFLELDESQFITESMVEEISSFTDSVKLTSSTTHNYYWGDPNCNNYIYGGYTMKKKNSPYDYPASAKPTATTKVGAVPSAFPTIKEVSPVSTTTVEDTPSSLTVVQPTQNLTVPSTTTETVPVTVPPAGNSYPNTNVVTGPTFRIKGTTNSNLSGLNELVEKTATYAQEHQRETANLALAMQQYGQQTGYPSNISVFGGPIFDIDITINPYSTYYENDDEYDDDNEYAF